MRTPYAAGLLTFVVVALMAGQRPVAQAPAGLVGNWLAKEGQLSIALVINADGTGRLDDAAIRYVVSGSTLAVTEDGTVNRYTFALNGNSLVLSGGDIDRAMVFERQGAAGSSGLGARRSRAADAGGQSGSGLVGSWQGPQGIVQIKADGTMLVQGTPYRYAVQGNTMMLTGNDGTLAIPFQLSGDTLTVSLNGQVATLTRTAAGAPSTLSGGGGAGISELAGKWCYFSSFSANSGGGSMTDECFTINPNGTYSYHREGSMSAYAPGISGGTASQTDDRGTVQLQGSTLMVISQSQGPSSYALVKRNHEKTGDAMLCLDGRCFVTAYLRPPWR